MQKTTMYDVEKKLNPYLILLFSMYYILTILSYFLSEILPIPIRYVIILVLSFLICMTIFDDFRKQNKLSISPHIIILLGVYILYISITFLYRVFNGVSYKNSLNSLITDITKIIMLIFSYYIIINTPNKNEKTIIKNIFLYGTLFFIIFAYIFQYNDIILLFKNVIIRKDNFSSFYSNRNGFGYFLFLAYVIMLMQVRYYKSKLGRIKYYIFLFLIFFSLIITTSRASILGVFVYTLLEFTSKAINHIRTKKFDYRKAIIFALLLIAGLGIFIYIFSITNIFDFIRTRLIKVDQGVSGRGKLWEDGIRLWKQNKFFGTGYFEYQEQLGIEMQLHNIIIETLIRNGLIGFIINGLFFIYYIIYHYKKNLISKKARENLFFFIIAFFMRAQFESTLIFKLDTPQIFMLFILTVFCNTSDKNIERELKYNGIS